MLSLAALIFIVTLPHLLLASPTGTWRHRDAGSRTMMAFLHVLLQAGVVVKFWPHNLAYSPGYTEMVRSVLAGMSLPELPPTAEQMLNYSRYFNLLSLTIPIAILVTLLVVRRQFFASASGTADTTS